MNSIYKRMRIVLLIAIPTLGVALLLSLLFAPAPTSADEPGLGLPRPFGPGDDSTVSLAAADLDNDGDLDLIVGNIATDERNGVYLNDGTGHLAGYLLGPPDDETRVVAAGDLDGDGDADLVVGNAGQSKLYFNDGSAHFPISSTLGGVGDWTTAVVLGDLDGDGDLDIVAANNGGPFVTYFNDGSGRFPITSTFGSSINAALALGDMDGDGDLDLLTAESAGPNFIHFNDGSGYFTLSRPFGPGGDLTSAIAVGDMDGDGDLDVVVANAGMTNALYLNDGGGRLQPAAEFGGDIAATPALARGDLAADGDREVAVGNDGEQNRVYLNDGTGRLPTALDFGFGADRTMALLLADLDDDGDLDIAAGNRGMDGEQNVIYLNDGSGQFDRPATRRYFGTGSHAVVAVGVADINNDGELDIVAAENGARSVVYINQGGFFYTDTTSSTVNCAAPNVRCFGPTTNTVSCMTLGDFDNDQHLDVAFGLDQGGQNAIYFYDGPDDFSTVRYFGGQNTVALDAADMDNDGDLDLIVGNMGEYNVVYLNDGQGNFYNGAPVLDCASLPPNARCVGSSFGATTALAVGDVDGDGDMDIAVGNWGEQNAVYLNDGLANFEYYTDTVDCASPRVWCFGPGDDRTTALALGDMNGDGSLDLVAGNYGEQNHVHLNDGTGFAETRDFGFGLDNTNGVAVGDMDGDGGLDIVTANDNLGTWNSVFINDGTGQFGWTAPRRTFGRPIDSSRALALGDVDGDGTLDIILSNYFQQVIYVNLLRVPERLSNGPPRIAVQRPGPTANGEGNSTPAILEGPIPLTYTLFDPDGEPVAWISASYSLDGGGHWLPAVPTNTVTTDLAVGRSIHASRPNLLLPIPDGSTINSSLTVADTGSLAHIQVWVAISHTWDADLDVYLISPQGTTIELFTDVGGQEDDFAHTILDSRAPQSILSATAPFTGTWRPEGDLTALVGENTAGTWTLRVTDDQVHVLTGTGTLVEWGLRIRTAPAEHTFTWDPFASGVFGQSDNAVLRLTAYPARKPHADTAAQSPLWPYAAATTFPFRIRGTQVRVLSGTTPVEGAAVYRLPAGQPYGDPISDPRGRPYRTDGLGYLQGRGVLYPGDRLAAMLPITHTDSYTLYYTSAAPVPAGLDPFTVTASGVQTLTVSPDHPLILLNLDLSLEWDGRNDQQYLDQLLFNLGLASESLYDWTDGQVALGQVRVYQGRQMWNKAHIRVYASNRLRPNAAQGGIVAAVLTDPVTSTLTYVPGQVHIGAIWNRYGDPGGSLGEDWARTLAHELGHYTLFLDDNYMGLGPNGLLVPVEGCPGAMSDPYRLDYPYDEFHPDEGWLPACENTLSNQATGRSDWGTITTFYPWLSHPVTNTGPSGLPLGVTRIEVVEPVTPAAPLADPTFYLSFQGGRVQPGPQARALLFQEDRVIDLGRPVLDYVLARGAEEGDRLCVYEPEAERLGCEIITAGDEQLTLYPAPGWHPDLIIRPVNSRTIGITVTNVLTTYQMSARLYPKDGPAPAPISLTLSGDGFGGVVSSTIPVLAGYVRVWAEGTGLEAMTDYALGGNPGAIRSRWGAIRSRWGAIRSRWAPAVSADGQVILFGDDLDFGVGEFFTLQTVTRPPDVPRWLTMIGHAYRLTASPNAPDLTGASLSVTYMGNEVPPGEEEWIRMYYWDGAAWHRLPTSLDPYHNMASGPAQGEGVYALMSAFQIPLYGPGWNLFSYPIQASRPVTEALLSISGYYTTVYGYEPALADRWQLYDVTVPEWVNELETLQFGHAYWINVSDTITLYLRGGTEQVAGVPAPPSTLYGLVNGSGYFTPTAGMTVTAWVGGNLCGVGVLTDVSGYGLAYVIDVESDDGEMYGGCGVAGRTVSFRVGEQPLGPPVAWDNGRVRQHHLWPDRAPVALGDVYTTPVGVPLVVPAPGVLGNDSDPDGDPLTAQLLAPPSTGDVALAADGGFVYTPTLGFQGLVTFTYAADDGLLSDTATVSILVYGENGPPIAQDDAYTTAEDIPLVVAAPGVLGNDSDPDGDPLLAVLVTRPISGQVGLNSDGSFLYLPPPDFNGVVSFTYYAYDGQAGSNLATVLLTVTPVNDPPLISDIPDQAARAGETVGPIPFTVEDIDTPVEALTTTAASSDPALLPLENIRLGGSGISRTITLTPAASLSGTVVVTVTVNDGEMTASDRFTLTVTSGYRLYLPLLRKESAGHADSAGCKMQEARCRMQEARCRMQEGSAFFCVHLRPL